MKKKYTSLFLSLVITLQVIGVIQVPLFATESQDLNPSLAKAYYEITRQVCNGAYLDKDFLNETITHNYSGLLQGELIDFDNNGIEELVLLRKKKVAQVDNYALDGPYSTALQGIILEIYTYTPEGVKNIFTMDSLKDLPLGISDISKVEIKKLNDKYVILNGYEGRHSSFIELWELQNQQFINTMVYAGEDAAYAYGGEGWIKEWFDLPSGNIQSPKQHELMNEWFNDATNTLLSVESHESTLTLTKFNNNAKDFLFMLEESAVPKLDFTDITEDFKADTSKITNLLQDTQWLQRFYSIWYTGDKKNTDVLYDVQKTTIEEVLEPVMLHINLEDKSDGMYAGQLGWHSNLIDGSNALVSTKVKYEITKKMMLEVFGTVFEMQEGITYKSKGLHGPQIETYTLEDDYVIYQTQGYGYGRETDYKPSINRVYDVGNDMYVVIIDGLFSESGEEIWHKYPSFYTMLVQEITEENGSRYVPLRLQKSSTITQETIDTYKVNAPQSSNIKIEYQADGSHNISYLEDIILKIDGKVNNLGLEEIYHYMRYQILNNSSVSAKNKKGTIKITDTLIETGLNNAMKIQQELNILLDKHQIKLNQDMSLGVKIDIHDIDWTQPVTLNISALRDDLLQNIDYILVLLGDAQHTLQINKEALKELQNKSIQITQVEPHAYELSFINENSVEASIKNAIYVTLPATSKLSTIQAHYKEHIENWGGQNSHDHTSISFETHYSGLYKVIEELPAIKDIQQLSSEQQETVNFMVSKGFLKLEGENFNPYVKLNRYDFNFALVKMFFALNPDAITKFTDIPSDNPYYTYIASAEELSIVKGFDDNTFRGEANVTKEQVLAFCGRTLVNKLGISYPSNLDDYLSFTDKNAISEWARADIALCVREGIISPGGMLFSATEITRIEATEILYNLFNKLYKVIPTTLEIKEAAVEQPKTNLYILGAGLSLAIVCLGTFTYKVYKKRTSKRNK